MRRATLAAALIGVLCIAGYSGKLWATRSPRPPAIEATAPATALPPLDARGSVGVREITRAELVALLSKTRPLSRDEEANLDRGCAGLASVYQRLGVKTWPETAGGTRAYLRAEDALRRKCPDGQENFLFLKQAWWVGRGAPTPDAETGEVPIASITHRKVGSYTFNYAVFFPTTGTYAWIDHRDYGFPINIVRPQKAFLSTSPPPLADGRTAQVYCSTCR